MKKICLFLSLFMCCLCASSYAQGYDEGNYDQVGGNFSGGGDQQCCPPADRPMNDCYCLYCRYEPCCYNKWHCCQVPQYGCKKCCRYVDQCYEKTCCKYVPQYYNVTCTRKVPQYYTVPTCHYVTKYNCERCVKYVPKYYYKHTSQPTCGDTCQPVNQPCGPQGCGY